MRLRLRGEMLRENDLVFELVKRGLGEGVVEAVPIERDLNHAPAGEVDVVVLHSKRVYIGSLARHGRVVLGEVYAGG